VRILIRLPRARGCYEFSPYFASWSAYRLKRFTNSPSPPLLHRPRLLPTARATYKIIHRETTSTWYPHRREFPFRVGGPIGIANAFNARSHLRSSICLCIRETSLSLSSRHRRNFNLGNIPPGTEKYRSAFFFPPFFVATLSLSLSLSLFLL